MEAYGQTIRQIRLAKGYSQKEIYTGIVSKSYAIEFEKGRHDMTVAHFVQVLAQLNLSFPEFEYIHHDYQKQELPLHYRRFGAAANHSDIPALEALLQELQPVKTEAAKLLSAQIKLAILRIRNQKEGTNLPYPLKEVQVISQYLLALDSWTIDEINLFGNCVSYFPFETQKVLMLSASKSLQKYRQFELYQDIYAGLLINLIDQAFFYQELATAHDYLLLLKELSNDFFHSWQREIYLCYQGFYLILTGHREQGEKQSRYIINHFNLIGQAQRGQQFETSLNNVLQVGTIAPLKNEKSKI